MIKHHPDNQLLGGFAADTLPLGLAIAVAAHLEQCSHCAKQVRHLEARLAESLFHPGSSTVSAPMTEDLEALLEQTLQTPIQASQPEALVAPSAILSWQDRELVMPRALRPLLPVAWQRIGKVARARLPIHEVGGTRACLLAIDPGGAVPQHQHTGYEVTLLLAGSMDDEQGHYQAGDFLLLKGEHPHTPVTDDGCLCYSVLDAPLQFTRGLPRLLNGFGSLLY